MKIFHCYYCKSKKVIEYKFINKEFVLSLCKSCRLIFTNPQPPSTLYTEINKGKYDSKEEEKSYLGISKQIYKRAEKYVERVQKHKKNGKYLDIGCSYGIYLQAAKKAGFETYGVEVASKAVRYANTRLGLKVKQGTIEETRFASNNFDVITLYDVLEHIPNMKKFLKEVNKILKFGGLLVIQCPNIESFAFKMLGQDWNWLLVPNHLWHFSLQSMVQVLEDNGFIINSNITWDSSYDFASNWVTKLNLTRSNTSLMQRVTRKIVYLVLYAFISLGSMIWTKYNKGGSLLVYAIKK